jgi:hypothetical protein
MKPLSNGTVGIGGVYTETMPTLTFVEGLDDHLPPAPRWRGGINGHIDQFDEWVRDWGWTYEHILKIPRTGWSFAIRAKLDVTPNSHKPKKQRPQRWSLSISMGHHTKVVASGTCRTLADAQAQADALLTEQAIAEFVASLYRDRALTTCLYRYCGPAFLVPYDRVRMLPADGDYTSRWKFARSQYYAEILQPQYWEPWLSNLGVIKYDRMELLPWGLYLERGPEGTAFINRANCSESTSYDPEITKFGEQLTRWVVAPEAGPLEQQ